MSSDLPADPLAVGELQVAARDVVRDDVARDELERVVDGDLRGAPADHDAELGLVVDLLADRGDPDLVAGRDERVRPFREQERPFGEVDALLLRVVAVVQTDADDLLGRCDHSLDPTMRRS